MELGSFPILELLQCLLHRQGGPVRADARHRVERVGHAHDPHFERDLIALQAVGKPFAVEPLVMRARSEEHTSELQSHSDLVCRLLLEKKKNRPSRTSSLMNSDSQL